MRSIRSFLEDESSMCTEKANLTYVATGRIAAEGLTREDKPDQRAQLFIYSVAAYIALM